MTNTLQNASSIIINRGNSFILFDKDTEKRILITSDHPLFGKYSERFVTQKRRAFKATINRLEQN